MSPEKFFDYLEGKLPPPERERLERALISDPELQKQFAAARQIHRGLQRPPNESSAVTRAGARGRQLAAAFGLLVALNVAIGLYFIFRSTRPTPEVQQAREEALRHQLQSSLEKSAAAAFTPPTIGTAPVALTIPAEKQDAVAQAIIAAAAKAGGSGTKALPNDNGVSVLVVIPASAEAEFRKTLTALGAPPPAPGATPAASPNEIVHLQIVLSRPL
ncbi:MAG: anti-sigma factor family protein [Chthoniobacterales bacterium]